jgi:hypothetical protein
VGGLLIIPSPISLSQSTVQAALSAFLYEILPGPFSGDPPAVFSGWITGDVLTVSNIIEGTIELYSPVLGAAPGTTILSQISGTAGGVGTYSVSVSQTLGSAPTGVTLATGVDIIAGQPNRAAEPANPFFVVMTPIRFDRLATNVDSVQDVKFTGSIAANLLIVTEVQTGGILVGASVFGEGVAAGTQIIASRTGSGGIGTYLLSNSQSILSEALSAGWKTLTQNAASTIQCDFHTSDTTAGDFAQTVSTALRDEFGVNFFAGLSPPLNGVVPLYADDPAQRPFVNAESQYEWRYVLDIHLEIEQTIQVPQTFADSVDPTFVSVEASYPI